MPENPFDTLMSMSMLFALPRSVQLAARLGVADAVGESPKPVAEIAAATGTHADSLNRVMRLLAAHGVFRWENGGYAHTPASDLLRSDHPQSMRSFVQMQGVNALWHIWEHMEHTLRTGRSAAEVALPEGSFWGYFRAHPEDSQLFNAAMNGKTAGQTFGILSAYDFSGFGSLTDVGGGNGFFLEQALNAHAKLRGTLFDLPHVVEEAKGIASDRLTLHGGDFFAGGLPASDAYIMIQILHDWSDEETVRILESIRKAAPPHAKLLLAEFLLPEEPKPSWTLLIDLVMMTELTGRERTASEFRGLLAQAGFRLDRVVDAGMNTFVLESSVV